MSQQRFELDEDFLKEFYIYAKQFGNIDSNDELLSSMLKKNRSKTSSFLKRLEGLVSSGEIDTYLDLREKLSQASSHIMKFLSATKYEVTESNLNCYDPKAYDLVYRQKYSSDVAIHVVKEFLQRVVPDMAKNLESRLSVSSKGSSDISETLDDLSDSNDMVDNENHSTDNISKPYDAVVYEETPLAKKLLDGKFGKAANKPQRQLISTPKKSPLSSKDTSKNQQTSFPKYFSDLQMEMDLEPYKKYVGKKPAYKIAEIIEKENPELAEALHRKKGTIIAGLDALYFFGE